MNTWEVVVVSVTAVGLMPASIRALVYAALANALLSRVLTLSLVLLSASLIFFEGDVGIAAGIAIFAANMVRRNGGKGALLYSAIATVGAGSSVFLSMYSGSDHSAALGLVWFGLALILVKGVAYVCSEASRLNHLPVVLREIMLISFGASFYYIEVWIEQVWSVMMGSFNAGSALIWLFVGVVVIEVVKGKGRDHGSELGYGPGRSGETTAITCEDLRYYYND